MKREWQPGDIVSAYIPTRGRRHVAAFIGGENWPWRLLDSATVDGRADGIGPLNVEDARPLVVIDPEDRESVERLVGVVHHVEPRGIEPHDIDEMQAALREFANPRDPKPDEPTGLGAVVEDATGMRWVRGKSITTVRHWRHEHGGDRKRYDDIAAVRVLSEGVTA